MPFQRSTAGFVFAMMVSVFLGSGVLCCWAEDCCPDYQVNTSGSCVSCILHHESHSPSTLSEGGCYVSVQSCDQFGQEPIVPTSVKSKLVENMALPHAFDGETVPTDPSSRFFQAERIHSFHPAGESLFMSKCSFLS